MKTPTIEKFDVTATLASIGALIFGTGVIFIKYLTGYLDFWTQNAMRYLAACLFWLPFLLISIRNKQLDKNIWKHAVPVSLVNIVMQSLWAAAFYYIDPTFLILLAKSSIIWVAAFSLVFFAEERSLVRSKRFWLGIIFSISGLIGVIVFKQDFTAQGTATGVILGLVTAVLWAAYTILAKVAFKGKDVRCGFCVVSIYTSVILCVLAIVFGKPQQAFEMNVWPWMCVVISGLSSIALTHVLLYTAIKRIGATIPSLLLMLQPFNVFILSHIFFGETLTGLQWVSGIILLAGSALAVWAQQHLRPKSQVITYEVPDD